MVADQKKDEDSQKKPIFQGYFGKYLADKDIARVVQKSFIRKQLISEAQVRLFNTLSVEYRNLKHQVLKKDLRIIQVQKYRVEFDRDMINLAIEPQEFASIETDANQNIMCREKMTLRLEKQSKSNSFIFEGSSAAFQAFNMQKKPRKLSVNEGSKRGGTIGGHRFSLVPYDQYRNSLIQVGRESNNMSEQSQRRSNLFESFNGQLKPNDPSLKDLNVHKEKMVDFFSLNASEKGD